MLSLSFAPLVQITEEEHQALLAKHGPALTRKALEMLSLYKHAHGASYNNDASACEAWAIAAARKRLAENGSPSLPKRTPRTCPHCGVAITHNAGICLECNAELPWVKAATAQHLQPQPPRPVDPAAPTREERREAAAALEGWRPPAREAQPRAEPETEPGGAA